MPPKKDKAPEYVEEEEEEVEKPSKKSTKKSKKTRRKDSDEYRPESEGTESEEYDTAETTEKSSSRKSEKKKTDNDDKEESTLKEQTKKVAQKLKEKKDEVLDQGKLSPPVIKTLKKKRSGKITDTEGAGGPSQYDKLLENFSLPSRSRPQVFNKNISMIGSLNIQAFGTKKSSNPTIMRIITDILRHYGIILCQEIRANEDIIQFLTDEVSTPATPYAYVTSPPIGRTTYQERYIFLYRKNEWKVLDDYVIDDDDKLGDKFIREPYVARFQHLEKSKVRVTLVGCHTQPDNAFEEIKTLINDVYMDVRKKLQRDNVQEKRQLDRGTGPTKKPSLYDKFLGCIYCCFCCRPYSRVSTRDFSEELAPSGVDTNEPIIMMGDLNAAGSYVNKTQRAELDTLLKKNNLIWGIQNNIDTTVADGSDAAYDRFIFETANESKWIGKTGVWRFDDGWLNGKTDEESVKKAAKLVTDHYPIEFELKLS